MQKKWKELLDQYRVSREQYERLLALNGKVDYIVTDGPLAHGVYYAEHNQIPEEATKPIAAVKSCVISPTSTSMYPSPTIESMTIVAAIRMTKPRRMSSLTCLALTKHLLKRG